MVLNNKKVGFLQISRFQHPQAKDIMTIGRIVIVPEFQGFGIGIKFMNEIANLYREDRIRITTSLKPFMIALNSNKNWRCVRSGRVGKTGKNSIITSSKTVSYNRITATFQYEFNK
jgi:GNAT superfamily N-acetyltransferase